jgi:hypothetical protein
MLVFVWYIYHFPAGMFQFAYQGREFPQLHSFSGFHPGVLTFLLSLQKHWMMAHDSGSNFHFLGRNSNLMGG